MENQFEELEIKTRKQIKVNYKNLIAKLLLLFVSILLILVVLEVAVRIFFPQHSWYFTKDLYIGNKYKTNIDAQIKSEDGSIVHFKTNKYGFVGENWDTEKNDKDVYRIVNLGDSFTAAKDVDFNKNYVYLLPSYLKEKLSDAEIESINFGVEGQGTAESLQTYVHYARKHKPNLVILWIFMGNDFEDNLVYNEQKKEIFTLKTFLKNTAKKLELAHFTINRLTRIPLFAKIFYGTVLDRVGNDELGGDGLSLSLRLIYTEDKENQLAIEKSKEYITRLKKEVGIDGAELLTVLIPTAFQVDNETLVKLSEDFPALEERNFDRFRPNREIETILKDLDILFYDLTDDFIDICKTDCSIYTQDTGGHLSINGHLLAVEKISDYIVQLDFGNHDYDD